MRKNVILSVIVPVYNAELTLKQCIDSILVQDIKDFELVLIDDGSTDQSPTICDEYAKQDSRIRVFHKDNGGVSSARNFGLDYAQGEWITFIDSDDYITNGYFESLSGNNADLLIRGYVSFNGNGILKRREADELLGLSSFESFINKYITDTILRGPVCKFYRRRLISSLRFPVGIVTGEDTYFVLKYLSKCINYAVLKGGYYMVRTHKESDDIRYPMEVEYAADTLFLLKDAFFDLKEVYNLDVASFLSFIGYYKFLTKANWEKHPFIWYRNQKIKGIYKDIWPYLPLRKKALLTISKFVNVIAR